MKNANIIRTAVWAYAAILTVMAVVQLFGFEKFVPVIEGYLLPGGANAALLSAGIIVTAEVLSLPFLLRMRVSRHMRALSLACCLLVPIAWLLLSAYGLAVGAELPNGGMFGAGTVSLAVPVAAQLGIAVLLGVLAIFASWGLRRKVINSSVD